jgi:hypothetical protein
MTEVGMPTKEVKGLITEVNVPMREVEILTARVALLIAEVGLPSTEADRKISAVAGTSTSPVAQRARQAKLKCLLFRTVVKLFLSIRRL